MTFTKTVQEAPPEGGESWILTDEAAARLHVHQETVREMLREGRLRGKKLGPRVQHHWLVDAKHVDELETKLLDELSVVHVYGAPDEG